MDRRESPSFPSATGSACGRLFVVAMPLGNLGDLSPRGREVLARADVILAEDTRRAGLLFQRLGLPGGRFLSFHEQNEAGRVPQVLDALRQGKGVALISDAGTPLLSDPGYRLVRACREAGLAVSPVPGPSAVAAALSACGLPPLPFAFLGFLPRGAGDIRRTLAPYAGLGVTLVFFERKNRLAATLAEAAAVLGPRDYCIARELTKDYEEFIPGNLADAGGGDLLGGRELLGELTVVIGPPAEGCGAARASEQAALAALEREAAAGGKPREVAQRAAKALPGWPAKELYRLLAERAGELGPAGDAP